MVDDKMAERRRSSPTKGVFDVLAIAVLVILPIITLYVILGVSGPSWDMIARSLNGKTLFDFITHVGSPSAPEMQVAFSGEALNSLIYYFEPYREPLGTPIFAALDIVFKSSIFPYMIVEFVVLVAAVLFLGRELGINKVIMLAAFLNPYSLYFFFVLNGGEGLAVAFVLIGIAYLLRRNPLGGLFLGIAVIAKYPALALVPLIILLWNKKKVFIASLLAAAPILIWGMIDLGVWGTPFSSYLLSIQYSNVTASAASISIMAILAVIAYPAILSGMAAVYLRKMRLSIKFGYREKVFASFIVLAFLGYIAILPHNNTITQARYGFLFGAALMLMAALLMEKAVKRNSNAKYMAFAIAIGMLMMMLLAFLMAGYTQVFHGTAAALAYYSPGGQNSIFADAGSELAALGYANCRVVSNAWILMLYQGYDTYSPFAAYPDGEQLRYPVVVFNIIGVPVNSTPLESRLDSMRVAYSNENMTIYLPQGAGCYVYNES